MTHAGDHKYSYWTPNFKQPNRTKASGNCVKSSSIEISQVEVQDPSQLRSENLSQVLGKNYTIYEYMKFRKI